MLPASTGERTQRAVSRGRPDGRTVEIQRLIGRALRSVCDFQALGERTLWLDCDVLQADGGTRCASITGAWIAARRALDRFGLSKALTGSIAAVSVGIVGGEAVLDLDYEEDSSAETDMNVVMTGDGRLVEVQATAERDPFSRELLDALLDLAAGGIAELTAAQAEAAAAPPCRVRLLLASRNENKLRELRAAPPGWEIALLDAPDEPVEDGATFVDNARIKARHGRAHAPADAWVAGEDSGIEVAALGGRPGVESARWAVDGVAQLLLELDGADDRRARYVCELVVLAPDGDEIARDRDARQVASRATGEATRGSATTRSSSPTARRAPSPSSGTPGRPSTRTAPRRAARALADALQLVGSTGWTRPRRSASSWSCRRRSRRGRARRRRSRARVVVGGSDRVRRARGLDARARRGSRGSRRRRLAT